MRDNSPVFSEPGPSDSPPETHSAAPEMGAKCAECADLVLEKLEAVGVAVGAAIVALPDTDIGRSLRTSVEAWGRNESKRILSEVRSPGTTSTATLAGRTVTVRACCPAVAYEALEAALHQTADALGMSHIELCESGLHGGAYGEDLECARCAAVSTALAARAVVVGS